MKTTSELSEWRDWADGERAAGRRVALVPTMGALHAGHGSLVARARAEGYAVVLTIFVNARQFNDRADLAAYPRPLEEDLARAAEWGVDLVVTPRDEAMWPLGAATPTVVSVRGLGDVFEGEGRPGHFAGVASVVTKLFALTGPCVAYFGEKDFQQLVVVRQLVTDLALPVEVRAGQTVRDEDGLALSSRNVRLSPAERAVALAVPRALAEVTRRPASAQRMREVLRTALADHPLTVHYVDVVDEATLRPCDEHYRGPARALVAVSVGEVRLLDNAAVQVEGER